MEEPYVILEERSIKRTRNHEPLSHPLTTTLPIRSRMTPQPPYEMRPESYITRPVGYDHQRDFMNRQSEHLNELSKNLGNRSMHPTPLCQDLPSLFTNGPVFSDSSVNPIRSRRPMLDPMPNRLPFPPVEHSYNPTVPHHLRSASHLPTITGSNEDHFSISLPTNEQKQPEPISYEHKRGKVSLKLDPKVGSA